MNNYIIIDRNNNIIKISVEYNSIKYDSQKFAGYSLADAIKKYRNDNNLRYKHLQLITI